MVSPKTVAVPHPSDDPTCFVSAEFFLLVRISPHPPTNPVLSGTPRSSSRDLRSAEVPPEVRSSPQFLSSQSCEELSTDRRYKNVERSVRDTQGLTFACSRPTFVHG
ncbi:hypothetical protein RRG08_052447 [Elysia crispata]|uniref:Uncharacterized protein n=1 Tax=Elysia crispata TaxID=231223 RepID=A0AAE1E9H0_9GAST|nr:hypothetical protein RRG08_052447 [Elysia crispata]